MTPDEAARLKVAIGAAIDRFVTDATSIDTPLVLAGPAVVLHGVDTSAWVNTFNETFDGPLDLTRWDTVYPWSDPALSGCSLPSNHEAQWYWNHRHLPPSVPKPWQVFNGVLSLVADRMPPLLKPAQGYSQPDAHTLGTYDYTSGMIHTRNSFSQLHGYFEIEAQLPAGTGLWPAFWLLPQNRSWPPEIDIFEMLGHEPNRLYTTVHAQGVSPSAHIEAWTDTAQWHRYGLMWTPSAMTLFIDGASAGGGVIPTPPGVETPMYMILDLAVGGPGSWPGPPDASTVFPAKMNVCSVRAWSFGP